MIWFVVGGTHPTANYTLQFSARRHRRPYMLDNRIRKPGAFQEGCVIHQAFRLPSLSGKLTRGRLKPALPLPICTKKTPP